MIRIALEPGLPGTRWACLRELCGHDEGNLRSSAPLAATDLLARLVEPSFSDSITPEQVWDLSVSERDRLLASVYRVAFGEVVEAKTVCRKCEEALEVSFSMHDLLATRRPTVPESVEYDLERGDYLFEGEVRFRLPSSRDLLEIAGLDPFDAECRLVSRCIDDADPDDFDEVLEAMDALGPVLDLDVGATCPECGHAQDVAFSLSEFLLGALDRERTWLTREVHALARAYGWSRAEILDLSRSERRAHVALITGELRAGRRLAR